MVVSIIIALIPTPLVFNKQTHTPAPKVHARTKGPCPHQRHQRSIPAPKVHSKVHARTKGPCPHHRSTPAPKIHSRTKGPCPHRIEPHPASVHSASPSCPQRCTLRGRRQVADRLPSGGDPAGCGRIISVVFSDACSDSTHARRPLPCPLLLTRVRMKLQSDRVNAPFKDQTALPRLSPTTSTSTSCLPHPVSRCGL